MKKRLKKKKPDESADTEERDKGDNTRKEEGELDEKTKAEDDRQEERETKGNVEIEERDREGKEGDEEEVSKAGESRIRNVIIKDEHM